MLAQPKGQVKRKSGADIISANPLALHVGSSGFVAIYRFGVALLVGLNPLEEENFRTRKKYAKNNIKIKHGRSMRFAAVTAIVPLQPEATIML